MSDAGSGKSVERFLIEPFGKLRIPPMGSIAYVSGNVPWIGMEEGSDIVHIPEGLCIPVNSRGATLLNAFSYPADVQILRGAPVLSASIGFTGSTTVAQRHASKVQCRATYQFANVAGGGGAAGRKRGVGIISKRGKYMAAIQMAAADTNEIIIFPAASAAFAALRGVGVLADELPIYRGDCTINDQLLCIAGTYTDAEITAWKAAAGYTLTEIRQKIHTSTANVVHFDDTICVFWSCLETTNLRTIADIIELGDNLLERR